MVFDGQPISGVKDAIDGVPPQESGSLTGAPASLSL